VEGEGGRREWIFKVYRFEWFGSFSKQYVPSYGGKAGGKNVNFEAIP